MAEYHQKRTCVTCDKKCDLFNQFSKKELEQINGSRYEIDYKAGEVIFKQGSSSSHIISFNSGLAKVYIEGGKNDLNLLILKPTILIGGPGMYVDDRHHYSLKTLIPSNACFIDAVSFKAILAKNIDAAEHYIKQFNSNCVKFFEKMLSLTQKQMLGRIADTLLYLSVEVFESDEFDMIISRQELANFSSMTKESAVRILKEMNNEKIIETKGNKIKILDKEKLIRAGRLG